MNNESRMWLNQMRAANPGWRLDLGDGYEPGAGMLASDVFIYLVDTSSDWVLSGSTRQSELRRVRRQVGADPVLGRHSTLAAAAAILEAGEANATSTSELARGAMFASACALAQTKTWDVALQRAGDLAGHWFYIAYRPRSGGAVGRPAFLRTRGPGFLPVERVRDLVRSTVSADLANARGSVGAAVRELGGAVLSAGWRGEVR